MTKKQWAIIGVLAVAVLLVFCSLATFLIIPILGINISELFLIVSTPRPTLQPTPTAIPRCNARSFLDQTASTVQTFGDIEKRAAVTSRIALSPVVGEMQQVRRDYGKIVAPNCAQDLQNTFLNAMDSEIDMYLQFMAQASQSQLDYQRSLANARWQLASEELRKLMDRSN